MCVSQEELQDRVEPEYKVFFKTDISSQGSKMMIFRGCAKFRPVAFFKIQDGHRVNMKSLISQ